MFCLAYILTYTSVHCHKEVFCAHTHTRTHGFYHGGGGDQWGPLRPIDPHTWSPPHYGGPRVISFVGTCYYGGGPRVIYLFILATRCRKKALNFSTIFQYKKELSVSNSASTDVKFFTHVDA